jgi:hypothetical protein
MRLSDLLRMTLENLGRQEIPLQAELDFVAKYLEIEQTRFADRLVVRFDIEPETLDALVPTLLLQPLVENAIKHGISKKSGPGHIDIRARPDHGKLWIEVRDNGRGLSETALIAMQKGNRRLYDARATSTSVRWPISGSSSTVSKKGWQSSSPYPGGPKHERTNRTRTICRRGRVTNEEKTGLWVRWAPPAPARELPARRRRFRLGSGRDKRIYEKNQDPDRGR